MTGILLVFNEEKKRQAAEAEQMLRRCLKYVRDADTVISYLLIVMDEMQKFYDLKANPKHLLRALNDCNAALKDCLTSVSEFGEFFYELPKAIGIYAVMSQDILKYFDGSVTEEVKECKATSTPISQEAGQATEGEWKE